MTLKAAAGVVSLLGVAALATGATLHRDARPALASGDLGPSRVVGGRTAGAQARIAFSSNGGVVLINADGSGREQLVQLGTGLVSFDSDPDWSPDGRTIAYARATSFKVEDQRAQIYLVGADGTGGRALTPTPGKDVAELSPAWSPDGQRIAFVRSVPNSTLFDSSIVVVDASGGNERVLARESAGQEPAFVAAPAWSPDGSRVLFTRTTVDKMSHVQSTLNSVVAAGGGESLLARDASQAVFSPDGSKIAYVGLRDHNGERCGEDACDWAGEIYVMSADGTGQTRLTNETGDDQHPSWSPDGRYIAFSSDRNYPIGRGPSEIYAINADGSCLTWLTNGTADSRSPAWGSGTVGPSAPGCGERNLAPLIATDTSAADAFRAFPLYWLGRSFRNLLVTFYVGDLRGGFFEYDDCARFDANDCPVPIQLNERFICSPEAELDAISLRRSRLRGALVSDFGQGTVEIYTGTTAIAWYNVFGRTPSAVLRSVLAGLRPLHGRRTARLPAPRFPTWLVAELDRTVSAYRRLGSVGAVHRLLHISRAAVRDRLRYARIVHSFRPLREIRCKHLLRPPPP